MVKVCYLKNKSPQRFKSANFINEEPKVQNEVTVLQEEAVEDDSSSQDRSSSDCDFVIKKCPFGDIPYLKELDDSSELFDKIPEEEKNFDLAQMKEDFTKFEINEQR